MSTEKRVRIQAIAKQRSRVLRGQPTDAERLLWQRLRGRQMSGHRFRRQHPLGRYIVDFACLEAGLIVEVDGGQHLTDEARDQVRTEWLAARGFRVLRFWNHEVLTQIDGVAEAIWRALQAHERDPALDPHPDLPPARGKE